MHNGYLGTGGEEISTVTPASPFLLLNFNHTDLSISWMHQALSHLRAFAYVVNTAEKPNFSFFLLSPSSLPLANFYSSL